MQGNVDHKSGIELRFLKSSTCIEDQLLYLMIMVNIY